jgi:leucyl aminopeptidase
MDFRHQISSPDNLASLTCDALVLVVTGDAVDAALDAPLAAALSDALAHGDLSLKAGKSLYLHRPVGVRAARVAFVAAGGSSVKAFKAAVASGINLVKGSGAKHVAIGLAGAGTLTDAHAEAVVTAARECTYLYRHTKPSAPAASKLDKVSVLCAKADVKPVQQGLVRGHAIAAGVNLAREWANRPGNHCTPTHLADVARKLGKEYGLKVEVLDRKACEKLGMGSFLSVAQASTEPLRFIVARYDGAAKSQAPVVLVGKGITFDPAAFRSSRAPKWTR